MKQQDFMDLLKHVDETTEDRIAEEFPVSWGGKEAQFEAVYRAYLKQTTGEEPPPAPVTISFHRSICRAVISAACLLLIVGLGVGVWSRQQRVEPRPPQETQTATVTETAETASETQPSTDTSPTKPETTASSQGSDRMQTTVSEAALLTSAPYSSASAAPQTNAAAGTTPQTTPEAVTAPTALPQTSVTNMEQNPPHTGMAPHSTGSAEVSSHPATDQTQCTTDPTQPPTTISPTMPATELPTIAPTQAVTLDPTEKPTEQHPDSTGSTESSEPGTELEQFPGFWVHWEDAFMTRKVITYREFVQTSPDIGANSYTVSSDAFQITEKRLTDEAAFYTVSMTGSEQTLEAEQISRRIRFSVACDAGAEVSCGTAGGHPCVWVSDGDRCTLYWDDGSFTFCIKGTAADRDTMEKIAGSMIPA